MDADTGPHDGDAILILDKPRDLGLDGGLLLGTEDAYRVSLDGIDKGSPFEDAFDGLLGTDFIEGDSGLVATGAYFGFVDNLVARVRGDEVEDGGDFLVFERDRDRLSWRLCLSNLG